MSNSTILAELQKLPKADLAAPELSVATVYLAAPYQSSDREEVKWRVKMCGLAARRLLELGIPAFSPCTYTAQWQGDDLAGGMEPANGWYELDLAFLRGCRAMIVLMLPGVGNSKGVAMETAYAKAHGIPLYRLETDDIIPT